MRSRSFDNKTMNKTETIIIGVFLGTACPLLAFVVFWWSAALLHMRFPDFPLSIVIVSALTGLSMGLVLDILFLRWWVQKFYIASVWLMIVLYLSLSIIAVAFFMGLPVGTFVLGIAAGAYMGRRESSIHSDRISVVSTLRKTALMTATVTTMPALPIGILALKERDVLNMLKNLTDLTPTSLRGFSGFAFIALLCVLLFLMQYFFSKKAGLLAFDLGIRHFRHQRTHEAPAHRD